MMRLNTGAKLQGQGPGAKVGAKVWGKTLTGDVSNSRPRQVGM